MSADKNIKNLAALASDYTYNCAVASLLLLLLNCCEDMEESSFDKKYTVDDDIKALKKSIHSLTANLKESIGDSAKKAAALESATNIKNKIISIYKEIYAYNRQFAVISSALGDECCLRELKRSDENAESIDTSLFFHDCIDFLESSPDIAEQKNTKTKLFECFPLSMTKDRFFDLTSKSLETAFSDENETSVSCFLEIIKSVCAPGSSPDYGKYFPEISIALSEKLNTKFSNLNDSELEDMHTEMDEIFDSLIDIEDYCQEILSAANSLIIICYLTFSFDELTETNWGHKDIYNKVCEMIETPDGGIFLETVKKRIEEYVEPVLDRANDINENIISILKKPCSFAEADENAKKALSVESFVRNEFYCKIGDEIFNFEINNVPASIKTETKKTAFSNFVNFMREYYSGLPFYMRKHAMRMLFSSLPIAMDKNELMEYIKNCVFNASPLQKLLMFEKAGTLFSENGLFKHTNENCECDHNHDSHECGCHSH
ncbi:MAG: hypothetical protein HFE62_00820 [Firmicutes bacterium]|nr:hypothetical protein [Bacillota bacterium]